MTDLAALSELSVEELQELIAEAREMIAHKNKERIIKAYAELIQVASGVGMSVEQLLATGRKHGGKQKLESTVPAKYANPDNPTETWSGRGRQPKWVGEKLASGLTLDALLISA